MQSTYHPQVYELLRALSDHRLGATSRYMDSPEFIRHAMEADSLVEWVPHADGQMLEVTPRGRELLDQHNRRQSLQDLSYEQLVAQLLSRVTEVLPSNPKWASDERVAMEVCRLTTGISRADWNDISKDDRIPWLEWAVAELDDPETDRVAVAERVLNTGGPPTLDVEPSKPSVDLSVLALSMAEEKVLLCLLESPALRQQAHIIAATELGENKVRDTLKSLEKRDLVHRPKGPRSGYALTTDAGKRVADEVANRPEPLNG